MYEHSFTNDWMVSSFWVCQYEMDAARRKEQTRERVRSYREKQTQSQREHRRGRKRIAERRRQETGVRRSQRLLAMRQEAQKRSTEAVACTEPKA